jgi:short-subunit dehydrogenase
MHLLVLGANSDIARAVAAKFAQGEKAHLYLASREMALLEKRARDLEIRYQVQAVPLYFEATDYASHGKFYLDLDPKPEGVVLAFGYLGDQKKAQDDFQEARLITETNFLGAVSILEVVAADFEQRGHGFIIGLSSPAGERGRQSNYMYGAAKGALAIYLSGLRNRLFKRKVHVMTVFPGFVQTKMIEGLDLPERLIASPEEVAEDIYRAYKRGKDVVYTRWFWKWIMLVIKAIPEKVFKRMSL